MADQFVGEIRIFAGNFAPNGWAFCDGQLMPISQNTALFSLLGTMYGGNGKTNFALPNLQGNAPLGPGQGPGLSDRIQGEVGGAEVVTLVATEMPSHTHTAMSDSGTGDQEIPTNNVWSTTKVGRQAANLYASNTSGNVNMSPTALSAAGNGLPHNNLPPYLTLNFIIALQGIYPPRG